MYGLQENALVKLMAFVIPLWFSSVITHPGAVSTAGLMAQEGAEDVVVQVATSKVVSNGEVGW